MPKGLGNVFAGGVITVEIAKTVINPNSLTARSHSMRY